MSRCNKCLLRLCRCPLPSAFLVCLLVCSLLYVSTVFFGTGTSTLRHDGASKMKLPELLGEHIPTTAKQDGASSEHSTAVPDFNLREKDDCNFTEEEHHVFPMCREKIEWMRKMWTSHPCYKAHGVDGSECSFFQYLSEVERWCPRRNGSNSAIHEQRLLKKNANNVTTSLEGLLDLLKDPNERHAYAWIRLRVTRLWPRWVRALRTLAGKQDLSGRTQYRVWLHLGLLSKDCSCGFAEGQFRGGPLGELVQWSDLITVLYLLGHQLTITSEVEQFAQTLPRELYPCPRREDGLPDLIFADIIGLHQMERYSSARYRDLRCRFRVLDSFGTEAAFNHPDFSRAHKLWSPYGALGLNTRQFFTMYPHTPDNSFMGFVVEHHVNDTDTEEPQDRADIALVYGKNEYMWEGKTPYLDVIHKYLEIHGTVSSNSNIPTYVINHNILPGRKLHNLLRKTKIFVGLGFPYEGPAPLEAIADGAVFLNPRLAPVSRENNRGFKGKPTSRELTSQNPYTEMFIGKPHVYTLDINNLTEVQQVVQGILKRKTFTPYTPYEFTEEGMLQRMNAYIQHQQFCNFQRTVSRWPPPSAVTFVVGQTGQSCSQACWDRDLICEGSYFRDTNTEEALSKSSPCTKVSHTADIYYPGVNVEKQECILQDDEMLFSCAGGTDNVRRLCPCRNYIPQQSALCKGCE